MIFSSKIYQWFIWILLIASLGIDVLGIIMLFKNPMIVSGFGLIMTLGFILRLLVLFALLKKDKSLKLMLEIWGALYIISAVTGLISLVLSPDTVGFAGYIKMLLMLILGLLIALPAKKYLYSESRV